mgnify:CR=1 FL=1
MVADDRVVVIIISIHALREEGDLDAFVINDVAVKFLSTPSARRATAENGTLALPPEYFYPRPPRGGRPSSSTSLKPVSVISIHALREEGDSSSHSTADHPGSFLSTPSARRATLLYPCHGYQEGGFLSTPSARRATSRMMSGWRHTAAFLSTPSARRATNVASGLWNGVKISIHALREEGDLPRQCCRKHPDNFYPRPPRGGRRIKSKLDIMGPYISIHALREEGDGCLPR